MHVKIESIDQKLMLNGSADLVTFLTLELPNGKRVGAQVEPDVAQALIDLASSGDYEEPLRKADSVLEEMEPEPVLQPEVTEQQFEEVYSAPGGPEEEDQIIAWAELPDEHLSPQMKKLLTEMGTAPEMPVSSLVALVDQVTERLLEAKAAQVGPPVGKVQRPGHLAVARPKTVPKDDQGYPIVPGSPAERDAGEVAAFGSDEDGVPQL